MILFDTHKKIRVYKRNYDRKSNYDWIGGIERRSAKIFPHLTAYDL